MSEALAPGTVIADRYTLRACLAATPHEDTYRAEASWGGAVILTIFTPPHEGTPTGARVRQAFLRSARLLAQVQHPGVPRVTDLIETPEWIVVVQEDRLRRSLRDVMGGAALPPTQAQDLTRCLFGALAAAHAQALLHTQLTPGEVWFDTQGQPVLAGFGLGRRALREAGQDTPPDARYAAPELLAGGKPSPQADVYALGATLLEAASGHAPPPSSARGQGIPLPPLPPGTRPAVPAALTQALALEPSERAVSAAEVLEGMDRAGAETPEPPASPVPLAAPAPLPVKNPPPPLTSAPLAAEPSRKAPSGRAFPIWLGMGMLGVLALGGTAAVFRLSGEEPASTAAASVQAAGLTGSAPVEAVTPPAPAPPPEPVVLRTVVVTTPHLNLRQAPTTAGAVLTTVARGERLAVLAEQGTWLNVQTLTGQGGWVSDQHTLPLLGEEATGAVLQQLAVGGDVTLARGVYWFSQPVRLTADVNLVGAGQQATLLMSDAAEDTLILQGTRASLTGLSVIHVGSAPARAVLQEGGTLTAGRVTLAGAVRDADQQTYGSGLWVKDAGHAALEQVILSGNAFGLYVSDTSHAEAVASILTGNSEGGALFGDDATGEVRGSTIAENGAHGVHVLGQAAPRLDGNRIRRNRGRGVTVYGQARPTVMDNIIEENTLQGVGVQGEAQPTLSGNTVQGNRQSGLAFSENAGGLAENNTVQFNLKSGIALSKYAAPTLSGNTIRRNAENGLSYADHTGGAARDNVISGNGNPGISAWGNAQPTLTGNAVQGNKQSGVVLAERSSGEFSGNTVSDNALYGLIVTGDAAPTVTENTVTGNARGGIFYKQNAGGSGYGNTCSGNGGAGLSAALNPDQEGPEFSPDGCALN
ncbi:hypothetical protein DEIPH_ctg103orf0037 [Deinococcus phoenicis]|uniref:Protein kinase domain-containing protein n=1 Tax=Deinococcus phoenicis TaxID=1476583 RepID=A0A016QL70_9DEIO|nr:right-handed parallel beta-helix repeat-containing protein [Deinococcus phoenicis]EYB66509.1 hypothetical protein DEIPH_ctg103orf0037 [Deinococcus phoenicis]